MSAFVVQDEIINRIISCIKMGRNMEYIRKELKDAGYDLENGDCSKLGDDMFKLNCQAVDERYGEGEAKGFRELNYKYMFNMYASNKTYAYKALGCWLYQCSEGNVPESTLYKLMESIQNRIACHIVDYSKEYEQANWG